MKHYLRYLSLVLFATMTSLNVSATDWVVPAPSFSPLTTEETVYVYNVGANRFYNRGEWWGTQAILSNSGMRFIIRTALEQRSLMASEPEDGEIPDGVYTLYSDDTGNGNHLTGRFDDGYIYVDSYFTNGKPSRCYWSITPVAGMANVYNITTPSYLTDDNPYAEAQFAYVEGQALGYNPDLTETTWCLRWNLSMSDYPAACQWAFVTPDEHALFVAKSDLKSIADDAESKGVDVSAAKVVFDNPTATVEEINQAIADLKQAISNAASPSNPTNLAGSYLINPTFDEGSGAEKGWSLDSNCQNKGNKTAASNDSEVLWIGDPANGAFNYPFWENWRNGNLETKMYQAMSGLPNGVYKVALSAFVQTLADDNQTKFNQYVYFNDQKFALTQGPFKSYSTMMIIEDGNLEMGFVQTGTGNSWVGVDNAELIYYGASLDSYKYMTQALCESLAEELEGKLYSQAYYNAVIATIDEANAASTKEEAVAAYEKAATALNALRENVKAYQTLNDRSKVIEEGLWNDYGAFDPLVDFIEGNPSEGVVSVYELLENGALTTEEAIAKLEELENLVKDALSEVLSEYVNYADGFIVNPVFKNSTGNSDFNGWSVVKSDNGFANNAGTTGVAEQWHGSAEIGSLNISQTVKLPKGAFRLSANTYYRCSNDPQNAYNAWAAANGENTGNNEVHVSLYAGPYSTLFNNLMKRLYTEDEKNQIGSGAWGTITTTEGEIMYSPDNCTAAYAMFNTLDLFNWDTSVDFISTGNPMTIGIKGDNIGGWNWPLWGEIKLYYLGRDLENLQPIFSNLIPGAEQLLDQPMAADVKAQLQDAINSGLNAEDAETIIKACDDLNVAIENANKSIDAYKQLTEALDELNTTIEAYGPQTKAETLQNAQVLYAEIQDGIANGAYTNEQIPEKVAEVNAMAALVRIPDGKEASDNNPIDYTSVIINPTYTKGLRGWTEAAEFAGKVGVEQETTAVGTAIGFAEGWNTSFDIYQDITGIPEGTYRVTVQGLYRQEGTTIDAKTWKYGYAESLGKLDILTDEEKENVVEYDPRAKFYANGDSATFTRWIFIPEDYADQETLKSGVESEGGWTSFEDNITNPDEPSTYYYPDNRKALANRCDFGWYTNELYCYVTEDGTLRIGACNKTAKSLDWVPFSNWRLEYLGTNSIHQNTTGISNIASGSIVSQSIYTADGRRINRLTKGLNIVKSTTSDGKTIVKKIIVK